MDKLSAVLNHFSISAGVFYAGNLCGLSAFPEDGIEEGHLHLMQSGCMQVVDHLGQKQTISEPSVLFFPRPAQHRLKAAERDNAQLICASVRYGTGTGNPLARALPGLIIVKLAESPMLQATTELLFEEAFAEHSGRQVMMDRLAEVFVIHLFRHVIDNSLVDAGMLAGLGNPHLAHAIMAIHSEPGKNWSLDQLAELSAMSRSRFAEQFRQVMGQSAGEYMQEWRISLAQKHLKRGKQVGWVANAVGYDNASALARVFRKRTGQSPREWLSNNQTRAVTDT
ncbi:MAG: AraC family transcriptional regulator [Gammaproteobacteria bacterium]